jgi:hypothetical protein
MADTPSSSPHAERGGEGFLDSSDMDFVLRARTDNVEWFKLTDDVWLAMRSAADRAIASANTNSWSPEAIGTRLLMRAVDMFQGVILLTERGLVAESRTLARGLIEAAFCIAALHDNADKFIAMLREDSEAARSKQAKFILAESLVSDPAAKERLQQTIEEIGKTTIMSPKAIAALGPLQKQYLSYQRLSDGAAHVTARSLHRYVWLDSDGAGWHYRWEGATRDETATTLYHSVLAALSVGVGITQLSKDLAGNAEFGILAERFSRMPETPVI